MPADMASSACPAGSNHGLFVRHGGGGLHGQGDRCRGGAALHLSLEGNDPRVDARAVQEELNLSTDQAREMETILDDYVLYYQNLQGQIADIRLQGHERILRILDTRQREKFESMMTELSSKAK